MERSIRPNPASHPARTGIHNRLVELGRRWVVARGFPIVATEIRAHGSREQPDVIGFRQTSSVILEVKASRADFRRDLRKPERGNEAGLPGGLGTYRFYLCPHDLLVPTELPAGWGLLWEKNGKISQISGPLGNLWPPYRTGDTTWRSFQHESAPDLERAILFSIARRKR